VDAPLTLPRLRHALQGVWPAVIASADARGEPNVTYLSKVFYVDEHHVALSNQFFSKTVANLRVNPRAEVTLLEPSTLRHVRLDVEYERSIDTGELFERARAEIDAVASLMHAENVFKLRGLDVYRFLSAYVVPSDLDQADG
jgi:predicted pyridoxine 5'-phosphate oxidase superfamily flavin-nucleotide-binding protein